MSVKSRTPMYFNRKHRCYLPVGVVNYSKDQLTLDSFLENVSEMSQKKTKRM